jgi:signal transduction histidine kinase
MSAAAVLVVHDLKNELGALEASLERLAQQPEAAAAEAAHRQCQQLRQRLVMYLTLYGIGHGEELRAHCEDESPAEMLAAIAARHGPPLCVQAGVEAPPFWYFDRRLVVMALEAAVHNALRYAHERVEVGLRVEAGQLIFTVDDDGPGLQPKQARGSHNTGLGTALCQAVALAHGGGVRLFNRRGPGQHGARFELSIST